MSSSTTTDTLEFDAETGLHGLPGIPYSDLTWAELRVVEDLLVDTFGPCCEGPDMPEVAALVPPF